MLTVCSTMALMGWAPFSQQQYSDRPVELAIGVLVVGRVIKMESCRTRCERGHQTQIISDAVPDTEPDGGAGVMACSDWRGGATMMTTRSLNAEDTRDTEETHVVRVRRSAVGCDMLVYFN